VKNRLVGRIRADLFRELAFVLDKKELGAFVLDKKELALGLDNHLVEDVIEELLATHQSISQAVPRLMQILNKQAASCEVVPSMNYGLLHFPNPKQHDGCILALHALSILTFAKTYSQERSISLASTQIALAFFQHIGGVDLVVDFRGLLDKELRTDGAALIRRVIADVANGRGFRGKVFFVDFPDDYRENCAKWRHELPRDFRRRIWCVTSENLEQ
jgi:hypothetical protein